MTSTCFTPFKIPKVRVTQLNSCGQAVTGCSTVVSDGIISVALTKEYEARQEFFVKNGNGDFCVKETNPPILKWINLVLTFCNVDPELINIMSAEPTYLNDAVSPSAIGYNTQEGTAANANFALEGWTRITNSSVPGHRAVGDPGPTFQGEVGVSCRPLLGVVTDRGRRDSVVEVRGLSGHDVDQFRVHVAEGEDQVDPLQDRWVGLLDAEVTIAVLDEELLAGLILLGQGDRNDAVTDHSGAPSDRLTTGVELSHPHLRNLEGRKTG